MNVYYIEYPEVSSGLRRTYYKKLEVFYGELLSPRTNSYSQEEYYTEFKASSMYSYNAKKNTWVQKPTNRTFTCRINTNKIFDTAETSRAGAYNNLEAACVSKILLIEHMAEEYKKALKELQELFTRNVPDVQQPLNQLLETHPDLFV